MRTNVNIKKILEFIEEYLKKYSFSKPRLEGEKLLSTILGVDRIMLYAYFDRELNEKEKQILKVSLKEMVKNDLTVKELQEEKGETNLKDYRKENKFIFDESVKYLEKYGVPNAKIDVEYIFSEILDVSRNMVTLSLGKELSEEDKDRIKKMLVLRGKNRYPLQYILGEWEFYGYPFKVDERVLIPRPDTEILVEQVKFLANVLESPIICDVGTGSGAIAITLGKEVKNSQVLGIDISTGALEVARENAKLNEAENVKFLQSNIFKSLEDEKYKNVKFDIIVSNPPYIPVGEYIELMPEVKNYEPKNALTDDGDGYYFYKTISEEAPKYLKDGGYLAFEAGYNQARMIAEIMRKNNFEVISIVKDYGDIERVVIGRKKLEKLDEIEELEEKEQEI